MKEEGYLWKVVVCEDGASCENWWTGEFLHAKLTCSDFFPSAVHAAYIVRSSCFCDEDSVQAQTK